MSRRPTTRTHRGTILLALLATTGCAASHAEGTLGTGEPLKVEWNTFRQGNTPIDEQDFYQIAGDRDAVDDVGAYRGHGVFMNRVGAVLAMIGAAALVTYAASGDGPKREASGPLILALPIGGITAIMGSQRLDRARHLPEWRAREAAARYNARVGAEQ